MTYQFTGDCADQVRGIDRTPLVSRILNVLKTKLFDGFAQYRRNRQLRTDRDAFRQMLSLDDEILDDIGVTRANVEWASQLPLHHSAGLALENTKKRARPKQRP